ncbi:MAG: rRNA maturation RNase YbeY [Candidatus Didemnitutus sp.]|nr:rRNA maturation RNase YbeY [Candidatus Didemnitutus sp.]
MLPADLPTFSRGARTRIGFTPSKIRNRKSEIPPGGCPPGELSLVFLTDAALAQLHAAFMDDPSTTDVITFEGDAAAGLAGEICVSADTAARYVSALEGAATAAPRPRKQSPFPADQTTFATELTLYLVHGWLHLAGYDDLQPAKKRRMRAAEARALKLLVAHDAIPAFALR